MLSSLWPLAMPIARWSLWFLLSWLVWMPVVALLEYATHRWIMHARNRWLDPYQSQLKAHGAHHQGANHRAFVDVPILNCLILTAPFLIFTLGYGLCFQHWLQVSAATASLLAWSVVYAWAWTIIHRSIHHQGSAWFRGTGVCFRFFNDHHMGHHDRSGTNFGTVFPVTDYLFGTKRGFTAPFSEREN